MVEPAVPAIGLTAFVARCADRNPYAMAGAKRLADALAERLGVATGIVGMAQAPVDRSWRAALEDARPALEQLVRRIRQVRARGQRPLLAMARCASGIASVGAAISGCADAKLIWFDAHADCNTPSTSESGYLGGMVISAAAGLWDSGFGGGLDLRNVVLVGTRQIDPAEEALIVASGMCVVRAGEGFVERLRQAVGAAPVYVHLDCDVLEPGIVPTEYAVPDGLSLEDLHSACSVLAGHEVLGLEIAEFESVWPAGQEAETTGLIDALEPLLARLALALH